MAALTDALPFVAASFLSRGADVRGRRRRELALTALDAGYTIGLTAWLGRTPGQMLAGIRVVDGRSRERPPWTRVALRWAVGGLPYPFITLLPAVGPEPHQAQQADAQLKEAPHHAAPASRPVWRIVTKAFSTADFVLAVRDPLRRGLGDRAARTVVMETGHRRRAGR